MAVAMVNHEMAHTHARRVFAAVPLALVLIACSGSDPGWIAGSPGAHDSTFKPSGNAPAPDGGAGKDADPGFRDPKGGDGGCALPNLVCGGACVAVGSDHDNCGACGNTCIGVDSKCNAGTCACSGPLIDYCAGVGCMDVSTDVNNCGSCGFVCDVNQYDSCVNGMCALVN